MLNTDVLEQGSWRVMEDDSKVEKYGREVGNCEKGSRMRQPVPLPHEELLPECLCGTLSKVYLGGVQSCYTPVTTLHAAVAPAVSSANPSLSYLPLFHISPLLNHLPLLSSFLALKHPYLTSTALLRHTPFLNHSPFFLKTLILSFILLLPRLSRSGSKSDTGFT